MMVRSYQKGDTPMTNNLSNEDRDMFLEVLFALSGHGNMAVETENKRKITPEITPTNPQTLINTDVIARLD